MTKSRFQLVGSLLRPEELKAYKTQIEHRDDIRYPFYEDFDGYKDTEEKAIRQIIADQKNIRIKTYRYKYESFITKK